MMKIKDEKRDKNKDAQNRWMNDKNAKCFRDRRVTNFE